ncbi:MAG TPA: DoxX family protein [Candidatus Eisenbacteria bacterium]|nr:DoxX family protein [Candidatus Eisenbacteria bacterium]
MPLDSVPLAVSKGALWTGRILSALVILFLLFDCTLKFAKPAPVVDSFAHLGIPLSLDVPIAVILLTCVLIYAVPQTAVLGAILLTGYLGGAVMTHLRAGDPLFSHILFPSYLGLLLWLGLYLREPRLRALAPFRL